VLDYGSDLGVVEPDIEGCSCDDDIRSWIYAGVLACRSFDEKVRTLEPESDLFARPPELATYISSVGIAAMLAGIFARPKIG
jgi:hypothetical protein